MAEDCKTFPITDEDLRVRLPFGKTTVTQDVLAQRIVVEQENRDALISALQRRGLDVKDIKSTGNSNVVYLHKEKCFVKKSKKKQGEHEVLALVVLAEVSRVHNLAPRTPLLVDVDVTENRVVMFLDDVGRSIEQWFFRDTRLEHNLELLLDAVCAQIVLALYALQRRMGFCHNDLHTKNVLVRTSNVDFAVEDDIGIFLFPKGVPFVCFTDFEFMSASGVYLKSDIWKSTFFSLNAVNNSFDIVRFFTSFFHPERLKTRSDVFEHLSPSLKSFGEYMIRFLGTQSEVEHFPFHVHAPTPAKILREKHSFVERFRTRSVPPLVLFYKSEEPTRVHKIWFTAKEARSNGIGNGPKKINIFPLTCQNKEAIHEVVVALSENLAQEVGVRVWNLQKQDGKRKREDKKMSFQEEAIEREIRAYVVRAQRVCRLAYLAMEMNADEIQNLDLSRRCVRAIDGTFVQDVWSIDDIVSGVCAENWPLSKFSPKSALDVIRQAANRNLY